MIQMLCLDLDGTLLNSQKTISENTRKKLIQLADAGIQIVPVTGRPLSGVPDIVRALPGVNYLITSNGAVTQDKNGAICRQALLPIATCRRILGYVSGLAIIREIFLDGYGYHDPGTAQMLKERFSESVIVSYFAVSRHTVLDLCDFLNTQTSDLENISLMFSSAEERAPTLHFCRTIDHINIVLPSPRDLEIGAEGADKGIAVAALASMLQIPISNVMSFGDQDNDRGLLSASGISVAMGNADDSLKSIADYVTGSHDNDGIADALSHFGL